MERGSNQTRAVVQIQNKAPVQLLIGTDLLPSLGVLFLLKGPMVGQGQIQYDLLQNTTWSPLATKPLPAIAEQSNAKKRNHESLSRAVAMESATVNIQQEKECDSLKISAEVHNNNCQLESSGLQSGMIAEVNNNNCQPENSSLHFGMLAKVDNIATTILGMKVQV